jgi:hypothetical protein
MGRQVIRTVMQLYGEVMKETLLVSTMKPTAWATNYSEASERKNIKDMNGKQESNNGEIIILRKEQLTITKSSMHMTSRI